MWLTIDSEKDLKKVRFEGLYNRCIKTQYEKYTHTPFESYLTL